MSQMPSEWPERQLVTVHWTLSESGCKTRVTATDESRTRPTAFDTSLCPRIRILSRMRCLRTPPPAALPGTRGALLRVACPPPPFLWCGVVSKAVTPTLVVRDHDGKGGGVVAGDMASCALSTAMPWMTARPSYWSMSSCVSRIRMLRSTVGRPCVEV